MELSMGGNAAVGGGTVVVTLSAPGGGLAGYECSAYLLGADGKVRGDRDMIFYNQPASADGALRLTTQQGQAAFQVALHSVDPAVERIVFCVTTDPGGGRRTLTGADGLSVSVGGDGAPICRFAPDLSKASEAALMLGELYRRSGAWKFRAIGQGFNGGLGPLARSFGIDVADDAPPARPVPAPAPPPPPAPAPTTPRVNLSKVSLDKKGQSISLEKRGASYGEILVNLNWSRGRRGFFGGGAIDLDLGCLWELADGDRGVVQALGRDFGDYSVPPFIRLDGDDRTGDAAGGENLRINGAQWGRIKRVAVFATIYEGVPNWRETDGIVTVTLPDQPRIEVRMTEGRNDRALCAVVLLENVAGTLRATRIVDYYRGQGELDRAYGWGMRWVPGRKD